MVEEPYRKTLGAQHRVVDDDHPQAPNSTNGLGVLHTKKKQYDEVELLLIQALKGRRLKLGDTHPHTKESLNNLIVLYEAWNKPAKANEWRARLAQIEDLEG